MPDAVSARQPLVIAGACGYGGWPPNSLEGAAGCLAGPVDGIEIDVHLTADGHVVLHHDYRLDLAQTRLDGEWIADRGAPLKERTLDELRRFDLGRTKPGSTAFMQHPHRRHLDGIRMPTLPEVLDLLKATGRRPDLYVEIKTSPQSPDLSSDAAALTDAVLRDLAAADYVASARVIAFDWRVLSRVKARCPALATSHLTIPRALRHEVKRDANGDSPWADGCDPRHHDGSELKAIVAHGGSCWSAHVAEVTPDAVAQARQLGLSVAAWGIANPADAAAMIGIGGVESITVSGASW